MIGTRLPTTRAAMLALALLGHSPAFGDEPATQTCALRVSEARYEVESHLEEERLAPLRLIREQAVLDLLQPLWEARSTERLRYLAGKAARDLARIRVDMAALAREQAETKVEVLEQECFSKPGSAERALTRYRELECELVAKEKRLAEIDLEYRREVLKSTRELRARELSTAQDLIVAEHDLDRAAALLRMRSERLSRCGRQTK